MLCITAAAELLFVDKQRRSQKTKGREERVSSCTDGLVKKDRQGK